MTVLKDLKAKQSRAAQVRSQLDYPVIDTDIHTNAYSPALEDGGYCSGQLKVDTVLSFSSAA